MPSSVCAHDKRPQDAAAAYLQVVDISETLNDDSVWLKASLSNARFFLGEDDRATELLRAIEAGSPDAGTRATIDRGPHEVAARVDNGLARLASMLSKARG